MAVTDPSAVPVAADNIGCDLSDCVPLERYRFPDSEEDDRLMRAVPGAVDRRVPQSQGQHCWISLQRRPVAMSGRGNHGPLL